MSIKKEEWFASPMQKMKGLLLKKAKEMTKKKIGNAVAGDWTREYSPLYYNDQLGKLLFDFFIY